MNIFILAFLALLLVFSPSSAAILPETGISYPPEFTDGLAYGIRADSGTYATRKDESVKPTGLRAWIDSLPEGDPDTVISIYVPGVMAQPVVQQRSSMYVSEGPEDVTQFRLAEDYGSIGLLAHNFLTGKKFFDLSEGHLVYAIYGDGHYQVYKVTEVADYQAISLYVYRNLETGKSLDQYGVMEKIYGGENDRLVFQTCIEKNGALSWGRRFVIAQLVSNIPVKRTATVPQPGGYQLP